jgi:hypothetical protein
MNSWFWHQVVSSPSRPQLRNLHFSRSIVYSPNKFDTASKERDNSTRGILLKHQFDRILADKDKSKNAC